MPKPFLELTLDQFSDLVLHFPWTRSITEVHMHHTWRPNHANFRAMGGLKLVEGMWSFHTRQRGFSDIAQHITIAPDGKIWTGRNWNQQPASATGFNGNSKFGPFMFEMIGDFDIGNDPWQAPQKDVAIEVIARIQKKFGLEPKAFRFHHEMNPKSCPGTSLRKPDVLALVEQAHARLAAAAASKSAGSTSRDLFGAQASAERASIDRLLRMFSVNPIPRSVGDEGELPEQGMSLAEISQATGTSSTADVARDVDKSPLTAQDLEKLRKHVINLRMGDFSHEGEFQSSKEDVEALFSTHIPQFLKDAGLDRLKLVFFAHGGLNDEHQSLINARNRIDFYVENKCYPIFFVWETGLKETLTDIAKRVAGFGPAAGDRNIITDVTDTVQEKLFRKGGFSLWQNMKNSAELSFLHGRAGAFLVDQIARFWRDHSDKMEIHLIGHSAGSIFHAHFIDALCRQSANPPITVESVHYLAPAMRVDLFTEKVMPLVGGRVKNLTQYTMRRELEKADSVGPYRKSLLYLVSRSFEDDTETPILGLEESILRDGDVKRFFGLQGNQKRGDILFSELREGPRNSTISHTHGDFDNDQLTMASVIRRILDIENDKPIIEFPETVSRALIDIGEPAPVRETAPEPSFATAAATPKPIAAGRRMALCVGIDRYPVSPLSGCVNDTNDWAATLRSLGFDVTMQLNEKATWTAMREALSTLVRNAQPGDVVVWQYAGHGTLVADLDGDEKGGKDSAFCPVDFPTGGFFIDDDVRGILQSLREGVNFTCFFDCCHSGTITRMVAPTPTAIGGNVKERYIAMTPELEAAHRKFREQMQPAGARSLAPAPRGPETMREISFTACQDNQTAKEIDGHGQFTIRAIPVLKQGFERMSNRDFYKAVAAQFETLDLDQTPNLDCASASGSRPLLAALLGSAGGGTPTSPVIPAAVDLNTILARLDSLDRRISRLER